MNDTSLRLMRSRLLILWAALLLGTSVLQAQKPETPARPQPNGAVSEPVAVATPSETDQLAQQIDALLSPLYPADEPGAAVIVARDSQVLFRKAYGMADLELGVPLRPEMVFPLASMTKQFTAAAIMILAEQGKLSVQDPITKFLPDYPVHGHEITIEHLLTHTSGIFDYTEIPGYLTGNRVRADVTLEELIDQFKNQPMRFAPGERFAYSNSGYVLLGAIIEKVSGQSYEEFLQEQIFAPLGMKDTFYGNQTRIIPNRVSGYVYRPQGYVNAPFWSMTQSYAAGALLSTVDDLALWDAALYSEKLLSKESLEKIFSPSTLRNGEPTAYGYGFRISKLRGRRVIRHGGWILGFHSHGLRLPDERLYVAILSNALGSGANPATVATKIAALGIGQPFTDWVAIELAPEVLEGYAGIYQIDDENQRVVTLEDGKLYTQRTGGPKLQAFPASETEFFYFKGSLTYFRLVKDEAGNVTHMLLYVEGADEPERAERTAVYP